MIVVERPAMAPGRCIVNQSSEDPGGFIDTLLTPPLVDPRVYVSRQAVIDMGRKFGFSSPDEVEALQARVSTLEDEADQLREDNKRLERDVTSADWTLQRRFGDGIQAKPGRPRKGQVNG